jgi:hypothetical protein
MYLMVVKCFLKFGFVLTVKKTFEPLSRIEGVFQLRVADGKADEK